MSLHALAKQPDARSQLQVLSDVCQGARAALNSSSDPSLQRNEVCLRLLFEILFQPYSAHLHRPLVATLRPLVAAETLKQASAAAISQCMSEQQRQWQTRHESSTLARIPLAAAWTSTTSCAVQIPIQSTCLCLQLLAEQIHCVLEQSQNAAAPMQAELAHDLKVRIFLCCCVGSGSHSAACIEF